MTFTIMLSLLLINMEEHFPKLATFVLKFIWDIDCVPHKMEKRWPVPVDVRLTCWCMFRKCQPTAYWPLWSTFSGAGILFGNQTASVGGFGGLTTLNKCVTRQRQWRLNWKEGSTGLQKTADHRTFTRRPSYRPSNESIMWIFTGQWREKQRHDNLYVITPSRVLTVNTAIVFRAYNAEGWSVLRQTIYLVHTPHISR